MIPAMPTDREQRENMSIKMKLTPFILCLGLSVSGLAQKFTADLLTNPARRQPAGELVDDRGRRCSIELG